MPAAGWCTWWEAARRWWGPPCWAHAWAASHRQAGAGTATGTGIAASQQASRLDCLGGLAAVAAVPLLCDPPPAARRCRSRRRLTACPAFRCAALLRLAACLPYAHRPLLPWMVPLHCRRGTLWSSATPHLQTWRWESSSSGWAGKPAAACCRLVQLLELLELLQLLHTLFVSAYMRGAGRCEGSGRSDALPALPFPKAPLPPPASLLLPALLAQVWVQLWIHPMRVRLHADRSPDSR